MFFLIKKFSFGGGVFSVYFFLFLSFLLLSYHPMYINQYYIYNTKESANEEINLSP